MSHSSAIAAAGGRNDNRAHHFDLFDLPDDYYDDQTPYFRMLRDHDPVHRNADGSILLTQYRDVRQVWRDLSGLVDKSEQFRRRFGEGPLLEHHTTGMLFRDPPDHDRLRAIVNPFFSQSSIASLRGFVEEKVENLLAKLPVSEAFDFVEEFSSRLPIAVICRIFGVPQSDAPLIQEMGRQVLFPLNPAVGPDAIAAGHAATADFKAYLLRFVEEARRSPEIDPTADIIQAMVAAERAGQDISENEILHMCILLLNGGHETTTSLISQSINMVLKDDAALSYMQKDDIEIGTAMEEFIRMASPLQLQGRRTTREIVLESGNGVIPPDTEVVLCQASANRDDRIFDDPDRLNLMRKPNSHVAFGAGVHVCIGRVLARLESSIAVPAFLRRFKTIERAGPERFARNARFRVMLSLPIHVS